MRPTQLIYEAWTNTPKPIIYNTNDGKGNPVETVCNFLDPSSHANFEESWTGKCQICGADAQGGIPAKKMFGSSYTDWSIHKEPESSHICKPCAFTMMMNTKSNRCCLFRYSFVADKEMHICNRAEMRDQLMDPPKPPFVMVVAVSQKKHLATKSKVSYRKDLFFCNFEEEAIEVDRHKAEETISLCEALRGIGLTKTEISKGIIRYDKIKRFGISGFDNINERLEKMNDTRLFELCLFVSQKKEEGEAICYLDLTPKMK